MKKSLKLATTINMALATLFYIKGNLTLYPLLLIILAAIYLSLLEKTSKYFNEKKSGITILSLITFFINPISGIILFIGQDKIKAEYNEKEPETKKQELTAENKKTITLLNLGIGLVGLSGIILATTNWNIMQDTTKILIILFISIMFLILSIVSEKKLKIEILSKTYWKISMLFMIFTVIANGYFEIISHWFSLNGDGKNLYIAFISIITSLISLITYNKYQNEAYKNISYLGIIISIISILLHFDLEISIILVIANAILILLNIKPKENIKETLIYLTYGIAIINLIPIIETKDLITLSFLVITIIINLLIIEKPTKVEEIINPLILNTIIITAISNIEQTFEMSSQILSIIIATFYSLLYLTNLIKTEKNETYKKIMNVITNVILGILMLINIEEKLVLTYITSITALTSIIIYYKNAIINEKKLLPVKIVLVILSTIALLQEIIDLNIVYVFIATYTLLFIIYELIKNEKLKRISLIIFYILFTITLEETTQQELIAGLINIIAATITTLLISKENNKTKTRISYILLLLTIATTFANTNILDTTDINNGAIILLIYIICTIFTYKNENLKKINYLSIMLPLILMSKDEMVDDELKLIIYNIIRLYAVILLDLLLIKEPKDRNIVTAILIPLIVAGIIFQQSTIIGIYVGILALILILIGYTKKEYKTLFTEGIIITIANVLIQFEYIFEELPLWIYTLLAGLIIIGLVTIKLIKENK